MGKKRTKNTLTTKHDKIRKPVEVKNNNELIKHKNKSRKKQKNNEGVKFCWKNCSLPDVINLNDKEWPVLGSKVATKTKTRIRQCKPNVNLSQGYNEDWRKQLKHSKSIIYMKLFNKYYATKNKNIDWLLFHEGARHGKYLGPSKCPWKNRLLPHRKFPNNKFYDLIYDEDSDEDQVLTIATTKSKAVNKIIMPKKIDKSFAICIKNLHMSTGTTHLTELLKLFGPIQKQYVQKDKQSELYKVILESFSKNIEKKFDVVKAISLLHGYNYNDLVLQVDWAEESSSHKKQTVKCQSQKNKSSDTIGYIPQSLQYGIVKRANDNSYSIVHLDSFIIQTESLALNILFNFNLLIYR